MLTGALIKGCHLGDADRTGNLRQGIGYLEQILPSGAIGGGGKWALAKFSTWYAGARRREQLTTLRGPDGTPVDAAA